jgi:hypothetical protein
MRCFGLSKWAWAFSWIGLLFEKLGNFFYILVTLHIAVTFVLGMGLAS